MLTLEVKPLTVISVSSPSKIAFMSIGKRIKQARLALKPKMTQQQLADAVGVSRPAVTQWETGETKSLDGKTCCGWQKNCGFCRNGCCMGLDQGRVNCCLCKI